MASWVAASARLAATLPLSRSLLWRSCGVCLQNPFTVRVRRAAVVLFEFCARRSGASHNHLPGDSLLKPGGQPGRQAEALLLAICVAHKADADVTPSISGAQLSEAQTL